MGEERYRIDKWISGNEKVTIAKMKGISSQYCSDKRGGERERFTQ